MAAPISLFVASFVIALAAQPAPFHAPHQAKHGGHLFPAAGDRLHIEPVFPEQRRLKLFVSDEYGRPLPEARLRAATGRVVVGDISAPLTVAAEADHLEARLPTLKLPVEMVVVFRLAPNEEEGFHITFSGYSDERNAVSFEIVPTVIPDSLPGILSAMRDDDRDAQRLFAARELAFVYAPADRVRDRLLALQRYVPGLPEDRRSRADAAIVRAVRAAWLLHAASDEGTVEQAVAALAGVQTALLEIEALFGAAKP